MNKISEMIGMPKFEIGDLIIHRYEWEEMNDDVIRSESYGVILGVSYCGDDRGEYIGWLYDVMVGSVKHQYPDGERSDIYGSLDICENIPENEICLDSNLKINVLEVIKAREKRILGNYKRYLKRMNIQNIKH